MYILLKLCSTFFWRMHSWQPGTLALIHSGTQALTHSDLQALIHSGTQALTHPGTQVLIYSGTHILKHSAWHTSTHVLKQFGTQPPMQAHMQSGAVTYKNPVCR